MPYTILLVDDDRELLEELKEMLTLNDYSTDVFSDGDSALKVVSKVKPDLILLDLKMPEKSGFQVAEELRHLPGMVQVPIIAMTGFYTEKEHRTLMHICGINDCLIKPFDPADVIARIETALKGKKEVMEMCGSCGCGQPAEKVYECEDCGRTAEKEEECCGKPMKKKEKPCGPR